jgi:hypothetical protein
MLNCGMLDKDRARELADGLDLDLVRYCPGCVFEREGGHRTAVAVRWWFVWQSEWPKRSRGERMTD